MLFGSVGHVPFPLQVRTEKEENASLNKIKITGSMKEMQVTVNVKLLTTTTQYLCSPPLLLQDYSALLLCTWHFLLLTILTTHG